MLGNSRLISQLHVEHCLSKGWIVLSPNHRLCPGVDALEGPVSDVRDLLDWVYSGKLDEYLLSTAIGGRNAGERMRADSERVAAVGCSSGGTLALSLVRSSLSLLYICGGCLLIERWIGLQRPQTSQSNNLFLRRSRLLQSTMEETHSRDPGYLTIDSFSGVYRTGL